MNLTSKQKRLIGRIVLRWAATLAVAAAVVWVMGLAGMHVSLLQVWALVSIGTAVSVLTREGLRIFGPKR